MTVSLKHSCPPFYPHPNLPSTSHSSPLLPLNSPSLTPLLNSYPNPPIQRFGTAQSNGSQYFRVCVQQLMLALVFSVIQVTVKCFTLSIGEQFWWWPDIKIHQSGGYHLNKYIYLKLLKINANCLRIAYRLQIVKILLYTMKECIIINDIFNLA